MPAAPQNWRDIPFQCADSRDHYIKKGSGMIFDTAISVGHTLHGPGTTSTYFIEHNLLNATVDNLKEDLKKQIIAQLRLEEITPADINDDSPLFHSSGLGLDSIDALELIVMFEKYHGLKVLEPEESKKAFHSITSMANYIREKKAQTKA